jgi:tetratricopeptide (TPR) repeat protein
MNRFLPLFLLLFAAACYRVPDRINPKVSYQIQDQHFSKLQSAFPPLSMSERASDWGREMIIAHAFAQELDLYRAVSTYKRAEILVADVDTNRKLEVQYDILLCFFLAKRYDETIDAFEKSDLAHVDKTFPAYHDLLLIIYESYQEMDNPEKQAQIMELMQKSYPETAEKLQVSQAIRQGDLPAVEHFAAGFQEKSYLDDLLDHYAAQKKSVSAAQALNAIIPGAGYLYIGQKKSALTAFLLNGLFIAAAYEFFHHGHTAAGIITTSFEAGWYFGGIYGAGEEAKYYNERIYEQNATTILNDTKLFPVLMIQYGF